jgi:hypothetical protein
MRHKSNKYAGTKSFCFMFRWAYIRFSDNDGYTKPGQASTNGANRKFSEPRKALGWRSWGTFFASFLWASKEMKIKNLLNFKQLLIS